MKSITVIYQVPDTKAFTNSDRDKLARTTIYVVDCDILLLTAPQQAVIQREVFGKSLGEKITWYRV